MQKHIFKYNNKDYIIEIGINAKNNWELFDSSNEEDILFHVRDGSSSYIILKNNEKYKLREIPRQIIKRCACLCKSHSNSKKLFNIYIIYSKIEHCEKGKKEGSVFMNQYKECVI